MAAAPAPAGAGADIRPGLLRHTGAAVRHAGHEGGPGSRRRHRQRRPLDLSRLRAGLIPGSDVKIHAQQRQHQGQQGVADDLHGAGDPLSLKQAFHLAEGAAGAGIVVSLSGQPVYVICNGFRLVVCHRPIDLPVCKDRQLPDPHIDDEEDSALPPSKPLMIEIICLPLKVYEGFLRGPEHRS